jgi:hypothetical protein
VGGETHQPPTASRPSTWNAVAPDSSFQIVASYLEEREGVIELEASMRGETQVAAEQCKPSVSQPIHPSPCLSPEASRKNTEGRPTHPPGSVSVRHQNIFVVVGLLLLRQPPLAAALSVVGMNQ